MELQKAKHEDIETGICLASVNNEQTDENPVPEEDFGHYFDSNSESDSSDLESGTVVVKKKRCRICQLGEGKLAQEHNSPIELGCSCKGYLAFVHKKCAETWFELRGSIECEICGSVAQNLVGIVETEPKKCSDGSSNDTEPPAQTQCWLHGFRLINFLLACMVLAIVVFWCLSFNGPKPHGP
ncbi:hypothetical protein HPP92_019379 [Vanilla planifolia]|uniref:RING-CH-type domain-containing protein n=1 Tax=Vanilla planifolia TaxID=51239 RepID=A0A835UHY5_VANPL|nr:hypothetical protein HPP92_019863 [Vanilla planifolia]KAG0465215.1 hypothetical protein HPP92_019379 [Vanilla planifolia]